jgi:hypothetical protein
MRRTLSFAIVFLLSTLPAGAIDWERLSINGYTSFEYEKQLDSEGEGAGDPNGSFDADAIDLVLNFQVSDKIRAATDITWEHGAATEDDRGNVAIEYAFVEYTFSDVFKVRAGKFLTPFGVFNQIHTAKPAFLSVKEAASTNSPGRIVEDAARFFPRWGSGIAFQGDGLLGDMEFDYDFLLANGEQDNTNPFEEDDNKSKSVTARFRLEPTESLQVGASYYYDKFSEGSQLDSIRSTGLELDWGVSRLRVLAEIVSGSQKLAAGGTRKQLGWFIQPSYHFDNGVTPYLRYDWIDPDTDQADDDGRDIIVGVNWEMSRWFMIKVENNWFKGGESSSLAQYPGRGYSEIKAALVLGF